MARGAMPHYLCVSVFASSTASFIRAHLVTAYLGMFGVLRNRLIPLSSAYWYFTGERESEHLGCRIFILLYI
jgi:hypothetical protein